MAKNKTTETNNSVQDFIDSIENEQAKLDSLQLIQIFSEISGYEAKMWGDAIIGFGSYHYQYNSGHSGDAPLAAFSPRKNAISLYLYPGFPSRAQLLNNLGKHKAAKSCVYIKKVADVNTDTLRQLIKDSLVAAKNDKNIKSS